MRHNHLIESQQFDRVGLMAFIESALAMQEVWRSGGSELLKGRVVHNFFVEPSTRTYNSFAYAAFNLGARFIGPPDPEQFSSMYKGETPEDMIRVVGGYMADSSRHVMVVRHKQAGFAAQLARCDRMPIINAGDGIGQHPTQALLDLFTIFRRRGTIDGLTVAMVGDLANGRTVHSLAYNLSKFLIKKIYFVAHQLVKMRSDILEHLRNHGIEYEEVGELSSSLLADVDVLYMTRVQKERFGDRVDEYEQVYGCYVLTPDLVASMKPDAMILHPLPRKNEIPVEIDLDPRAAYFEQAHLGVPTRMTILAGIFGKINLHLKPFDTL